jgi:hypothetical protein
MGIFGGSRRHVFKPSPYETRRRSRRLPRWFVLLVVGILLGGGGVLILQASYGPKRLTIAESQTLTDSLAALSLERQQLQTKVTALERDLKNDRFQAEQNIESLKKTVDELTTQLKPVRDEIALFMQAATTNLSFDPIGLSSVNLVQPRNSADLAYHMLLVQKDANQPVFDGRVELTFEGRYPNGRAGSVRALVLPIKLGHYQHLVGDVELPNGFQADRGTLRVFQGESTRALSFRTYNVAR